MTSIGKLVVGSKVLRSESYPDTLLHGVVVGGAQNQEVVVVPRDGSRGVVHQEEEGEFELS